jgi:hypothetical protein
VGKGIYQYEVLNYILFISIAAPAPSNVQSVLATKCYDNSQNKSKFFYVRPNGGCDKIDDLHGPEAEERHIADKNVVFAFQVCLLFLITSEYFKNTILKGFKCQIC